MTHVETSIATAPARAPGGDRRWLILGVLGVAQLRVILDAAVIDVPLPSAQKALHSSNSNWQWIITGYLLPVESRSLLGGRLSDLPGRRLTFATGVPPSRISQLLPGSVSGRRAKLCASATAHRSRVVPLTSLSVCLTSGNFKSLIRPRMSTSIRIAVLEDHPAVGVGLERVVPSDPELQVLGFASSKADLWALLRGDRPDVVLALHRPGRDGPALCRESERRQQAPSMAADTAVADEARAVAVSLVGDDAVLAKSSPITAALETIRALARAPLTLKSASWRTALERAATIDPADHVIFVCLKPVARTPV
jgi:CheY-like chemotaxis protein